MSGITDGKASRVDKVAADKLTTDKVMVDKATADKVMADNVTDYKIYNASELRDMETQWRSRLSDWICRWFCPREEVRDVRVNASNAFDSGVALQRFPRRNDIFEKHTAGKCFSENSAPENSVLEKSVLEKKGLVHRFDHLTQSQAWVGGSIGTPTGQNHEQVQKKASEGKASPSIAPKRNELTSDVVNDVESDVCLLENAQFHMLITLGSKVQLLENLLGYPVDISSVRLPGVSAPLSGTAGTVSGTAGASSSSAIGSLSETTGTLSEATGTLSEATGSLSEATGSLSEATGSLSEATGSLSEATGTLSEAAGALSWGDDYCPATQKLFETALAALASRLDLSTARSSNGSPDGSRCLSGTEAMNSVVFQPESAWRTRGRGWVHLDIEAGGAGISVLLAPRAIAMADTIRDQRGDDGPKGNKLFSPGKEALFDQKIQLRAELGGIDLSIGDFRSLQCGDVLRLNAIFSDKVVLKTAGDKIVCRGLLGKSGGRRAVKLI